MSSISSRMIYHSFCIDFGIGSRTFGSIVLPRHRIHTAPSGKMSSQRTTMMTFLLKTRKNNNDNLLAGYDIRISMYLTRSDSNSYFPSFRRIYADVIVYIFPSLRTVPTFVSAHTYCASRKAWLGCHARAGVTNDAINYATNCKIAK